MGTGNGLCGIELNLNKNNQSKIINKIHWCLYAHYYMLRKTSLSMRKQRPKRPCVSGSIALRATAQN